MHLRIIKNFFCHNLSLENTVCIKKMNIISSDKDTWKEPRSYSSSLAAISYKPKQCPPEDGQSVLGRNVSSVIATIPFKRSG